jgi:hypothetical protein
VRPPVRGGWYHKRVCLLECGEQRKATPTTGSTTAGRPAGDTNHHTTTHPTRCVHTTRTQLSRSIVPHAAHSSQRQDSGTQGQRPTQGLFLKALGASVMWLLGTGPPTLHRPGDQLCRSTGASHRQAGGSHTTSPCTTTGHPTASEHTNTRHSTRGKPASTHTPGTHHTTRQGKPRCGRGRQTGLGKGNRTELAQTAKGEYLQQQCASETLVRNSCLSSVQALRPVATAAPQRASRRLKRHHTQAQHASIPNTAGAAQRSGKTHMYRHQ